MVAVSMHGRSFKISIATAVSSSRENGGEETLQRWGYCGEQVKGPITRLPGKNVMKPVHGNED
jgi:hypothetical protein